jgi:NAD(P)-dependent dehydrogenase (short-subunit alcohol dehydrogenase family)
MGSLTPTATTFNVSIPTSLSLLNRTAIVTGGTRGIGKGIALELARRGASVAIVYANPKNGDRAEETVKEIKAAGIDMKGVEVKAVAILADLKDPQVGERIVREMLEGLGTGKIDILGKSLKPGLFGRTLLDLCWGYDMSSFWFSLFDFSFR